MKDTGFEALPGQTAGAFLPWLGAAVGYELRGWYRLRWLGIVGVCVVGALLPLLMVWMLTEQKGARSADLAEMLQARETLFQGYFLRFTLFFGLMGIFMQPVALETSRQSIHHVLLTPLPRGMLLLGKYGAGLLVMMVPMMVTGLLLGALPLWVVEPSQRLAHMQGLGPEMLLRYVAVTGLACVTYGALFLSAAYLSKSASVWILGFYMWEWFNALLPGALKPLSVIYHLQTLCPFQELHTHPVGVVVEREPPLVALAFLLGIVCVSLAAGQWKLRSLEIRYDSSGNT